MMRLDIATKTFWWAEFDLADQHLVICIWTTLFGISVMLIAQLRFHNIFNNMTPYYSKVGISPDLQEDSWPQVAKSRKLAEKDTVFQGERRVGGLGDCRQQCPLHCNRRMGLCMQCQGCICFCQHRIKVIYVFQTLQCIVCGWGLLDIMQKSSLAPPQAIFCLFLEFWLSGPSSSCLDSGPWFRGHQWCLHGCSGFQMISIKCIGWIQKLVVSPLGIEPLSELIDYQKVRVWQTDSLHGDSPFTEQPGQCGEEGDYIQVNIFSLDKSAWNASKCIIITPGVRKLFGKWKLIRAAWIWLPSAVGSSEVLLLPLVFSKQQRQYHDFRYGVFEEHGYPGDQRYPTFYTQQIWTANGPE